MRVIYFTFVPSTKYLRFYYKPSVPVDGVIALENDQSFVCFTTPQQNVQETLRLIDKDIELHDCRFSYSLEDMLFFMSKSDVCRVCQHTTRLLSNFVSVFEIGSVPELTKVSSGSKRYSYSNLGNKRAIGRSLNFLN